MRKEAILAITEQLQPLSFAVASLPQQSAQDWIHKQDAQEALNALVAELRAQTLDDLPNALGQRCNEFHQVITPAMVNWIGRNYDAAKHLNAVSAALHEIRLQLEVRQRPRAS